MYTVRRLFGDSALKRIQVVVLFVSVCTILSYPETRIVKVGIFPAAPLVFVEDGKPQGLFIDLIDYFAQIHHWHVDYVNGTWDNLQAKLSNGEIDLLPALGYSAERATKYDFSKNPVYIDYGVVFTSPKFNIHTIYDLRNKRVASLSGSIFTAGFIDYIHSFGIRCDIIYTSDNAQVMEAIQTGKADAGISIYSLGNELAKKYPVVITPISFAPIALHYAVCKGRNADLIIGIDSLMAEMIVDPHSFYSNAYYKWTASVPMKRIPAGVLWGIAGLVFAGLLLASWNIALKRSVKEHTKHLAAEIGVRKQAEDALRHSQQRLELATQSAQLGIWDWDIVQDKLIWDDQMFRLYGISEKPTTYSVEIWQERLHPDDAEYAIEECMAAIRGDKKYDSQFRIKRPDETIRFIKAYGTILRDSSGTAIRMLGINRDITDQKNAEEEHLKYEKQMQLNSKLESLGILAGGIAHDFNNLMGGFFGYLDIALEHSKDDVVTQNISKAVNTIERARALTQQLLTFAKGGAPILKVGNLFPFIKETTRFALSGSPVSCNFDIQPDLWACSFDKNQISQVIDNLVINAHQSMPNGGTIELAARNITLAEKEHPLLEANNYVKISIKDSGIGIPKDILPQIFDPFFTTKAKGHGLGLATCYSIIKQHHGCIDVVSEPGKGSTFHVYLPASEDSVLLAPYHVSTRHHGSGTFIVMDDEEVIRETICAMLTAFGYTVVCKVDGKEAIDFYNEETKANRKIAGMIFDITIPGGLGGKVAVREIRKTDTRVPVFVVSGYADDPIMKNPAAYGFTASICKPFRKSELVELLNTYL